MLRESSLNPDEKVGFWKKLGICLKFGWSKIKDGATEKPWPFWIATILFAVGGLMYIYVMLGSESGNVLLIFAWLTFAIIGHMILMTTFNKASISSMLAIFLWTGLYVGLIGKALLMPLTGVGGQSIFASISISVLMMALCFGVWMILIKINVDQIWSEYSQEKILKSS